MKKSLKAPCSCSGNVKQYEPGYTAPPPKKSKINVEAMSIRIDSVSQTPFCQKPGILASPVNQN
ncbi:hypothetical protein MTR_3g053370 [Medicago truncatula]|uniref:Uncharacterized protein n=1 Tax=Medicago truncatula TaxID=3880 RepID=A0A072V6X5_MEDTR|nr:hypothetical protein MTR_3g053370 [Medicago truncatula]